MPRRDSRMSRSSSTTRMLDMLRLRRDGRSRERKFYYKPGSQRLVFLHANRPAMVFNDPPHNGQSQPGAAFFGGEVRKKKSLFDFVSHAMSSVSHDDFYCVFAFDQRS